MKNNAEKEKSAIQNYYFGWHFFTVGTIDK
jgi:hypothetical protein